MACLPAAQPDKAARPPVILISIDTLRADHLGIYGRPHNPTPHIDSFAENGTFFTQIDSQIPLTLPSHTVLFTSTYPFQNHIEENAEIVPSGVVTLASVLQKNGYHTGAFIGSSLLSRRYGLNKGFETYDSPFFATGEQTAGPYSVRVRRDGALVIHSALNWLTSRQNGPAFAFIHLFDLHTPYAVRGFSGQRLLPNAPGYDAEIQYVDELLGHLKDTLVRRGLWQRSVVIVLADHGESLGDHGETSHGYFAYESTLHVPLIVHWPESDTSHPKKVDEPAGLIDVAPTLLNYLHIAVPTSFAGKNLLDNSNKHEIYSETAYAHDAFRWAMLCEIRIGETVYISAPHPELYNLQLDPTERKNVIAAHADEARSLKAQLAALLARYSNVHSTATADRSGPSQAALRSLGYIAAGLQHSNDDSGPDPKDRLPEYQAYEKALTELYSNQATAAVTGFRNLLAKDPANTLARYYLGESYMKLNQPSEALREWQAAIGRDHGYEPALVAMGDIYLVQKLPAKARDAFEQATLLEPMDSEAQLRLAVAEEQLGQTQDANRHIEAACRAGYDDSHECEQALAQLRQKFR